MSGERVSGAWTTQHDWELIVLDMTKLYYRQVYSAYCFLADLPEATPAFVAGAQDAVGIKCASKCAGRQIDYAEFI